MRQTEIGRITPKIEMPPKMIFGVFNARKSKRDFLKIGNVEFFSDTGVLTGRWVEKRRRTEVLTRQKTKNIVKILYTIDSTKNVRGKNAESGKKRRIVL